MDLKQKKKKKKSAPVWPGSLFSRRICVRRPELTGGGCASVSSSGLVGSALYVSTDGEACCGSAGTASSTVSDPKKTSI